jgi:hypothetical protein
MNTNYSTHYKKKEKFLLIDGVPAEQVLLQKQSILIQMQVPK